METKNSKILFKPMAEFTDPVAVLYAPQKEYVMNIVPLMLEHAWFQKQATQRTTLEELMFSGWIVRLITLDSRVLNPDTQDDIPGWTAIKEHLIFCLDTCKEAGQVPGMLWNCMSAVQPGLERRFEAGYFFPPRMFHCWWYTIDKENTTIALHLVNAYQPDSPFNHQKHFLSTMLQAVEQALGDYPGIKSVSCGSWLNQLPKFQQLWPAGFSKNQIILNEAGGLGPGAWGQYMTTAGGFSETKAAVLRQTGKHPFALTEAHCPAEELTRHLKKIISEI